MTLAPTTVPPLAPENPPFAEALLALLAGLAALGIALLTCSLEASLPTACAIAGAALGGSLVPIVLCAFARREGPRLSVERALGALAFGAFAALLGATAGSAIPQDLHLFTLGRPPVLGQVMPFLAFLVSFLGAREILRGASPRRIFLYLLVPALTLEGLPLATPAWAMLALAGGACLVARASRPVLPLAWISSGVLVATFALCAALGADPGTSLDVVVRIAALSLALVVIAGEGEPGARSAIQATLFTLIGIAALGGYARLALARELADIGASVRASGLSLFGRHPNLLASWFAATALLALHAALQRNALRPEPIRMRVLGFIAFPLALTMLALTASRLAIVAVCIAGCLPILGSFRMTRRSLGIAAAIVLALVAGAFALPALRAKFTQRANLERSVDHRQFRIGVGLRTALAKPVLGQGPLCWFTQGAHTPPSYFVGETSEDHPHCLPIAILQGTGVVGIGAFLLFLAFGGYAARVALRRPVTVADGTQVRGNESWPLARGVLLAAITQLLTNVLDMGDALETLVPSRLFLDFGILAALAGATRQSPVATPRLRPLRVGATTFGLAAILGLSLAFATRGRTLMRVGLPLRAAEEFERSLRLVPIATGVHLDLATAAFTANKRTDARSHLERALEIAPGRADLYEALANLRSSTGDSAGALAAARRAYELDPHGATPRRLALVLAELELAGGQRDRALALIATAMRIDIHSLERLVDPQLPGTFRLSGATFTLDEVLAAYEAQYPEIDARLKGNRLVREVELSLMTRDLERAARAQSQLEATQPEDATTFKFAAAVARARGRYDEALRAIEECIARYPSDPTIRAERADLMLATGIAAGTVDEYRRALPNTFDVYFQTGSLHEALTRLERAQFASGATADRRVTLRALAFLKRMPEERARVFLDLATSHAAEEDSESAMTMARRALREILAAGANEGNRAVARQVGVQLGALGKALPNPSALADELERTSFAQAPGVLTFEFRVALLTELGLTRRAEAAVAELRAIVR